MRTSLIIVAFMLFTALTGCKKHKMEKYPGVTEFSENFDDVTSFDPLLQEDGSRWDLTVITRSTNTLTIDTTRYISAPNSMRCFAEKSNESGTELWVSKASILKSNMAFWDKDVIETEAWYYMETNSTLDAITILDLEEYTAVGSSPGLRLFIIEEALLVERKFYKPWTRQPSGEEINFPINQWVHIKMELGLSIRKKGYVKVWQDGNLIIDKVKWQTLPKDFLYQEVGSIGRYNSFEIGISANGQGSELVMYVDDISIRKIN